ncbi:MAG: hypothetical protein HY849_02110 [Nitrosomonadales bacterium]|nr:hypothetical protein [Nitrosomonadales bacterium]
MNKHKLIIGCCWLAIGLAITVIAMLSTSKTPQNSSHLLLSVTAVSSAYVLAAYTLLAKFTWSRWICLPFAILTLPFFPIGSIFSAYYLWYFLKFEWKQRAISATDGNPPNAL